MSLLTSGYLDDYGFDGPGLRYIGAKANSEDNDKSWSPSPARKPSHHKRTDSVRFSRPVPAQKSILKNTTSNNMAQTSLFTPRDLAAIAKVLLASAEHTASAKQTKKDIKKSSAKVPTGENGNPWKFRRLSAAEPGTSHTWQSKPKERRETRSKQPPAQPESFVDPIFEIEDDATSLFQSRKGKSEPTAHKQSPTKSIPANSRQVSAEKRTSHSSRAPSPESLPLENDASGVSAAEQIWETPPDQKVPAHPGKMNKKQQRKEQKAKKAAERAAAAAAKEKKKSLESRSLEESVSPSVKVKEWEMDPHSKPASNASFGGLFGGGSLFGGASAKSGGKKAGSRRTSSEHSEHADNMDGNWGEGGMGDMFAEPKTTSRSSHKSHSKLSKKALSFMAGSPAKEDSNSGAGLEWAGSHDHSSRKSHSRHSRSGSRKEGSKLGGPALDTIPEDLPFEEDTMAGAVPGAWGDDAAYPHSKQASSHHSHRSRKNVTPNADLNSPEKQKSARGVARASYKAPTVQDVPDVDGWEQEQRSDPAYSRRSSRSSYRQGNEDSHAGAERTPSHRSYGSHKGENRASVQHHSLRSRSTEKVDEWFSNIPAPSEGAISQAILHKSRSGSHASRRSHQSGNEAGWESGRVPSEASLGTGYEKRTKEASDVQGSTQRWGHRQESDKRTSSASSTRADLGMREPSLRSGHSSKRSWKGPPVENNGEW